MLEHGGGIRVAARQFGGAHGDWLDLSTGINPHGWQVPVLPATVWNRLPEDDDGLEVAARDYYGCGSILPAAGSQAIIQTLPRLRPVGRVGILSPTYAEHAHAWRKEGFSVVDLAGSPEDSFAQLDVLVVVNPNNPTARTIPKTTLLDWRQRLWDQGSWLVVDEAFMDADSGESVAANADIDGLLVLRSLGKFFGLAGARVGFLLGCQRILLAAREQLGPWNVAGPSRWVATEALTDRLWQRETRTQLAKDSQRLTGLLVEHGLPVTAKTALFQWVPNHHHHIWWESLARLGILVRRFDQLPGLRFGLPKSQHDWLRLADALGKIAPTIPKNWPCPIP